MSRPFVRPFAAALAVVAAALSAWTVWRGQDVNWDRQNYHLYDVFALLHGRRHADVAPGGSQSFLNPLPYLVPYLARRLPPLAGGLAVTATQLPAAMLAWGLAWQAWGAERDGRGWVALVAALGACTSASALTETGTSFADLTLAAFPLAGMLLLLPRGDTRAPPGTARLLAAGLALGAASGLKPTHLFLLPGLALAVLAALPAGAAGKARGAALAAAGFTAGAALTGGFWALRLWQDYGSPVFPFMNTVFRSRSAAVADFDDPRYRWRGVGHALRLPFDLAAGTAATGEVFVRDVRLALALPLAALILLAHLRRARERPDPLAVASLFLLGGTAGWMALCPVQRYAVPLEMSAGVLIALCAARAADGRAAAGRVAAARWRIAAAFAALTVLAATTRPGEFFHRPWSDAYTARVPAAVPPGGSYGLLLVPLSYWVVAAPVPAHAFTLLPPLLQTGGRLQRRLDDIVADADDRLWLLNIDVEVGSTARGEMSIHGIALAPPCLRTASPIFLATVFCKGRLVGPRAYAASDLASGETAVFNDSGAGLIYEIEGWDPTEPDGTWAVEDTARLAFHADAAQADRRMALQIVLAGVYGAPPHRVRAQAGGGEVQEWTLDMPEPVARRLCVGPERLSGGVVEITLRTDDTRSLAELGQGPETRHLAFKLAEITLLPAEPGECADAG